LTSNGLSGFDMLEVVVPFTIADAVCDADYGVTRMSKNVEAFGYVGHDIVVKVKEEELVNMLLFSF
jgi:hypothetical protein